VVGAAQGELVRDAGAPEDCLMGFRVQVGPFGNLAALLDDCMARFEAPLTTEPIDAPAGGGGETPPENTGAEGDPPPSEPVHAGNEDDDDEFDDDPDLKDDGQPITSDRFKRVTGKLAKLNRRDKKFRTTAARLKDLEKQGLSLDDLVVKARQYDGLDQQIRSNPRLRSLIFGGEPDPVPARREPVVEPEFDEAALPFDPNENDTNRYFANLAKNSFEQHKVIRQLQERLNGFEGKDNARTEASIRQEWKSTIDTAAAYIKDEGVQTLFKDAMTAAYHNVGRNGKYRPSQIANHYLKALKVNPQQAAAATAAVAAAAPAPAPNRAATAQRIAENNRGLSRNVAPAGIPAPARNPRETLADVRKRLTGSRR
jgi:hypothetical protein